VDVEDDLGGPDGSGCHLGAVQNEMGTVLDERPVLAAGRLALRSVDHDERVGAALHGRRQLAEERKLATASTHQTSGADEVEDLASVVWEFERAEAAPVGVEGFGTLFGTGAGEQADLSIPERAEAQGRRRATRFVPVGGGQQ